MATGYWYNGAVGEGWSTHGTYYVSNASNTPWVEEIDYNGWDAPTN